MFAVVFEVNPRPERWDEYLRNAGLLRPELMAIDGFITNERYIKHRAPGLVGVTVDLARRESADTLAHTCAPS